MTAHSTTTVNVDSFREDSLYPRIAHEGTDVVRALVTGAVCRAIVPSGCRGHRS